jgi:multiple antibiotic resistance protein
MIFTNPAELALNELTREPLVRFSVLALSSIFFLVDPFAAVGSFLAITEERQTRSGASAWRARAR